MYGFLFVTWALFFTEIQEKCVSGRRSAANPAGGAHDAPLVGWGGDTPLHIPSRLDGGYVPRKFSIELQPVLWSDKQWLCVMCLVMVRCRRSAARSNCSNQRKLQHHWERNGFQTVSVSTVTFARQSMAGSSTNPLTIHLISDANIFVSGLAVPLNLRTISGPISFNYNVVPINVSPLTTKTVKWIILRIMDKLTVVTKISSTCHAICC